MQANDPHSRIAAVARGGASPAALRAAGHGLDWLNLFVANIQTGFGPFIAIYLTTAGWTQTQIGFALSLGTITAMVCQLPAGALVDAVRSKTRISLFSIIAFSISALMFAVSPVPLFVYLGAILHGFASCTLGPAVAAMSLAIAGPAALGVRLGRNARFASIGNGVGAVLMGACGYLLSNRLVFFLTAILTIPAIVALGPLVGCGDATRPGALPERRAVSRRERLSHVMADRRLLIFALCATLFTFSNAAMLPLASTELTKRAGDQASLLIALCIILPQVIVALLSPTVGELAQQRGRRSVLLLGFITLPLRGLLFALFGHPLAIIAIQALDGIAAATFTVMVPLVTSDVAGISGHFNLSLGFVGFTIGIGSTISTTVAGWTADHAGDPAAFISLAMVGLVATLVAWLAMPETRPAARPAAP